MSAPIGSSTSRLRDLLLLLVLVAGPAVAARVGSQEGLRRLVGSGPLRLALNLGPGDGPYVSGFTPEYEIEERVATHWTTYEAAVRLPLTVEGGPTELSYRFARVLPETAVVQVFFGRDKVDEFKCRGGIFEERSVSLWARDPAPVAVAFRIDSHDRKNLGLKLDWVRIDPARDARVRPTGAARWRPALLVALLFALMRWAGWRGLGAALLAAPWAAGAALGLLWDPWTTHRLLTGVPEALAVAGLVGVGAGRYLAARGRASAEALRGLAALGALAFLVRALAVNHPDFYYPDLRTHARLVGVVRGAGLDFLRSPSVYIWDHGVWRTQAYGRTYAFPYTPAFHVPFALLPIAYDHLLTAMKLAAGALSVVPLILVWALARRLGASTAGALLMVVIPTYTSRLSFAFLPALLGHAVDMAFLLWLAARVDRILEPRTWLAGAGFVAACQLAYVSGVVNIGLFVAALALLAPWEQEVGRGRRALAILAMGLAGCVVSVLVYYRDFLGMAMDVVPRILGGDSAAVSRYPVRGFLEVAVARTRDFFDGVYPLLALAGLALLLRRGKGKGLLVAWVAAYLLLLLGRARLPDLFLHGHETLFVTPLVCLCSGEALASLGGKGRWGPTLAGALLLFLAAQGLAGQWRALAAQLGNAL